ncbi:ABC-type uncharacterized transport system, periplasmic component [Weissella viridescens]|nr:ABC-type uncharacterized transport system, periplasmic component [Weissella viridescens]
MVSAGGVAANSIDQHELGVMTGKMIVKELKGEQTKDLPVEYIKQGKVVINQKQADELGLKIPVAYQDAKRVNEEK